MIDKRDKILMIFLLIVFCMLNILNIIIDKQSYLFGIINDIRIINGCFIGFLFYNAFIKPIRKNR